MKPTPQLTPLDCGHAPTPPHFGTANTAEGRTMCYDCANDREREFLKTAQKFLGYLSSDGSRLTTWPGADLGKVTMGARHPWSDRHTDRRYISVVDCFGTRWRGTGAPGMWASLRRCKASI